MEQQKTTWHGKRVIAVVRQSLNKDGAKATDDEKAADGSASTAAQLDNLRKIFDRLGMQYVDKVVLDGVPASAPARISEIVKRLFERKKIKNDFDVIAWQINELYVGTLVYNRTSQKLKTPTRHNPKGEWVRTAGVFDPIVEQAIFERAQTILAQAALRYGPEFMLAQLERLLGEHDFIRPSLLQADSAAPSASTYAKRFGSLDAAYQQAYRLVLSQVRSEVESLLRALVKDVESYDDFLVVNGKFTVLVQPSMPVPHGYSQYWYFRPDTRVTIDITLGVPVSGPKGPQILGYLALPRLMVQDHGIRLFGSSESRLDMYGHTGLEFISLLSRSA
jgi:hypothetical protein